MNAAVICFSRTNNLINSARGVVGKTDFAIVLSYAPLYNRFLSCICWVGTSLRFFVNTHTYTPPCSSSYMLYITFPLSSSGSHISCCTRAIPCICDQPSALSHCTLSISSSAQRTSVIITLQMPFEGRRASPKPPAGELSSPVFLPVRNFSHINSTRSANRGGDMSCEGPKLRWFLHPVSHQRGGSVWM